MIRKITIGQNRHTKQAIIARPTILSESRSGLRFVSCMAGSFLPNAKKRITS
jgi:hypothetical protein